MLGREGFEDGLELGGVEEGGGEEGEVGAGLGGDELGADLAAGEDVPGFEDLVLQRWVEVELDRVPF